MEFRILAHLSGDVKLKECFADPNRDPFIEIGKLWFKKEEISKEDRSKVKAMVYGTLYGQGPKRLSANLGCSVEEADKLGQEFMSTYPQMSDCLGKISQDAETNMYCETLSGRRRSFDGKFTPSHQRIALNTTVQVVLCFKSKLILSRSLERLIITRLKFLFGIFKLMI